MGGYHGGYDYGHPPPPPPYGSYGAGPSSSVRYTADHPIMRQLNDMMQGLDVHDHHTKEMQGNLARINQQTAAIQQQLDAHEPYIHETWAMTSNAQDEANKFYKYHGYYPDA